MYVINVVLIPYLLCIIKVRVRLVSHEPDSLRESLVHYSRAVRSDLE